MRTRPTTSPTSPWTSPIRCAPTTSRRRALALTVRAYRSQDGVLNVVVGSSGTFVLNKQAPNLQLWLSSPVSGPLRYNWVSEAAAWHNSRDEHELLDLLAADFETLCGSKLDFARVAEVSSRARALCLCPCPWRQSDSHVPRRALPSRAQALREAPSPG